jgi:hypothetical protein
MCIEPEVIVSCIFLFPETTHTTPDAANRMAGDSSMRFAKNMSRRRIILSLNDKCSRRGKSRIFVFASSVQGERESGIYDHRHNGTPGRLEKGVTVSRKAKGFRFSLQKSLILA